MRHFLSILLFLICSFVTKAQVPYPINQNIFGPSTLGKIPPYGAIKGGIIPLVFTDTSSANSALTYGKWYDGFQIKTLSPINAMWWRDSTHQTWVQYIPGGGGTGTLSWNMGGNNPIVSDGSGYGLIGPQTSNGLSAITNNVVRFSINTSGAFGLGSGRDFGTAGQALLSQGNGSAPIWGTPSSTTPTWQQTLTAGSTLSSSNTIVSGANTQTFTFNTLNGTGFSISSSSTSGVAIPQKLLSSVYTGAHASGGVSSYAGFFSNQHTGSTSLNVGVWAQAFGGTTNVGLLVDRGSIDIGLTGTETGILNMYGSTSGKITFKSQAAAGTYNMNWPTTAGTSGYLLTSAGGGSSPMTWTDPSTLGGTLTATYIGYGSGSNTLTGNANLTYTAASNAVALDSGYLSFTGHKDYGSAVNGSIFKSSLYGLTMRAVAGSSYDWLVFNAAGSAVLANPTGTTTFGTSGNFGVSLLGSTISARLHIAAGTTTAGTAPLKFNAGTNLTAAEAGAMEWDGTNLFITQSSGPTRKTLAYTTDLANYWALTGTNTLTGNNIVNIDRTGSGPFRFSIQDGASNVLLDVDLNNNIYGLGDLNNYAGKGFIKFDVGTEKAYLMSGAIFGGSTGDALTVVDPSTGEIGVAPNLAFNLMKENTMIYAKNGTIFANDAFGNSTAISPHPNGAKNWTYSSTDKNGITTTIDMIKLAEVLERVSGEKLIYRTKD